MSFSSPKVVVLLFQDFHEECVRGAAPLSFFFPLPGKKGDRGMGMTLIDSNVPVSISRRILTVAALPQNDNGSKIPLLSPFSKWRRYF
jgi:hypothetical protein